ncbi:TorF family putative porin [Paracraurococcus lichenis]|uniref:TorF family putative porin n=1 Tax=Paracraurococcus lichenis TaxID=3064888 RepID=A0ABT9E113_9PROT|nr:TorF family putative porin [Paracraurococcus sp. LOR1-02]MDO9709855.1 TorF family putative porin [Paracraurococcus sp. LOR1-02]
MPQLSGLLQRPAALLRGAVLAAAAFVLPALPAAAQQQIESLGLTVTTTPAISNDYLFRGISQTRNNWAYQGTLDIQHESGVYVGAFLSNAKFLASPWNDTRQELDLLAGYRFEFGGINFDIGYIAYTYPGQDKAIGTQLNEYQEIAIKANYTIDPVKILAAYNYSPNFFGHSGAGNYVEGGADVTLPFELTASGRLGYQWIQNNPRFGTPDYLWYSIGVSREIYAGVTATVAWYDTNIRKSECAPVADRATNGQRICEGRVLFTLSKIF